MYSTPGYVRTDATYYVETNLYSTGSDGRDLDQHHQHLQPHPLETTVDGIMQAVYWQMKTASWCGFRGDASSSR